MLTWSLSESLKRQRDNLEDSNVEGRTLYLKQIGWEGVE
jgi:hypothetical protein